MSKANGIDSCAPPQTSDRSAGRRRPPKRPAKVPTQTRSEAGSLSAADLLKKIAHLPGVRNDLVAKVKARIKAGTYETPERLEAAARRLAEELRPDP